MARIALCGESRKALACRLRQAYDAHASRLTRRIHALLWLADGQSVLEVAETLDLGEQTVRDWLHACILQGVASLFYRSPTGRPTKLTPTQRQELKHLIGAGPEAAGYPSACSSAAMIADLIKLRFKVEYNPHYVCQLLASLGFSFQKARFSLDHPNDEEAIIWLEETWPEILRVAKAKQASIFLEADEEESDAPALVPGVCGADGESERSSHGACGNARRTASTGRSVPRMAPDRRIA